MKFILRSCILLLMGVFLDTAWPQTKEKEKSQDEKIKDLSEKIEILSEEIEKQKAGEGIYQPISEEGKYGLGPAASKVYRRDSGISIGGYGEITYQNFQKKDQDVIESADKADVLRIVLYLGHKFTQNLLLNLEIEYEHANKLGIEFAYIDYLFHDLINFRAGLLLAPMGLINELHEPTTFLGVTRPSTERYIIPTTWREIGLGIFGEFHHFSYKLYLMNSFKGSSFDAETGIRGGRQKGSQALAENFGGVVRIDYGLSNFLIGVSSYLGETGQTEDFTALTSISDFHIDFKWKGIYLRSLFSFAMISDADKINDLNSFTNELSVGEQLLGAYAEIGYDLFQPINLRQLLIAFFRYEFINTQFKVPDGFTKNPENEKTILTFGLSYKPIIYIAIKLDYQIFMDEADAGIDRLNIALTYIF